MMYDEGEGIIGWTQNFISFFTNECRVENIFTYIMLSKKIIFCRYFNSIIDYLIFINNKIIVGEKCNSRMIFVLAGSKCKSFCIK